MTPLTQQALHQPRPPLLGQQEHQPAPLLPAVRRLAAKDALGTAVVLQAGVLLCRLQTVLASSLLASKGSEAVTVLRVETGMKQCQAAPDPRAAVGSGFEAVPRVVTGAQADPRDAVQV